MFWLPMCSANLPKLAIDLHCKQHVKGGVSPLFYDECSWRVGVSELLDVLRLPTIRTFRTVFSFAQINWYPAAFFK